jgi:GT2 family glycosyltransferase
MTDNSALDHPAEPGRNKDAAPGAPTGKGKLVAIVILNWNGKKYLEKFLDSVTGSSYLNKRIIVADNASTDGSVSFLKENYPSVEIIQNSINGGFAKGYNDALTQVKADYYVLLNSDVEVTPGWIEPIISLMESDEKIAACQPKILSYKEKTRFEYAGACGGWIDRFGYPFSRGRIFEYCEEDKHQYDDAAPCFWASGAAMFIKADLYHQLQGLDEYFFAHQEEIDLCWRLQHAGYSIYVQPASVVYHVGGGTLSTGSSLKTFLNFRNNLIMLYKNLPGKAAFFKIPFRLLLDAVAAWKALLGGDARFFSSVGRAHVHFIKWILFYQHKSIFPKTKKMVTSGCFNGSVVWQHYVKKKTKFSEIVGNK